jgi:hypothetical protein
VILLLGWVRNIVFVSVVDIIGMWVSLTGGCDLDCDCDKGGGLMEIFWQEEAAYIKN